MTEDQYRQSVADIFGEDIKVPGRFEPLVRQGGLLEVGTAAASVTPAGFEQFDSMARTIAAQVMDEKHVGKTLSCRPSAANAPDNACAESFLRDFGRRLFRRPLSDDELNAKVGIAHQVAERSGSFDAGLQLALAEMLESPEFLFRIDSTEPDPQAPGKQRLDGYSRATRLSFLLWNTTPDDELLAAAARGDLYNRSGLSGQVDRMLASSRLNKGLRAFFSDMLGFDSFDALEKDGTLYPAFSNRVAEAAKEQTLLTIVDHLLARNGDYRDLFTERRTFMNRALGPIYYVPVEKREGWQPFEFAADDPRAGLLAQISFTALYAHPGRSSATLRGKAIREVFLCQKIPAPPANVNFTIVQNTDNPVYRTARARLTAHRTAPACAGCHKIMDPIGLSLENFDGAGQYRDAENGVAIDASGELDGVPFSSAAGLGKAMHDNPAAPACLANDYYRYAVGREATPGEREWVGWLAKGFASDGYRLRDLLRRIATSNAFFATGPTPDTEAMVDHAHSTPS